MNNPLNSVVKTINDSTNDDSAMIMDQIDNATVEVIPTGIESIDAITGIGGVPLGKITEIFGNEGTGKTTICLHIMKKATEKGLGVGFVDSEHALSYERIMKLGIDKSNVILSQPDDGEQALEIMEIMIRSDKVSLVICDSVAALTPRSEIDKDFGDAPMGGHARLMSQAMRKLVAITSKKNVALVFTNQIRKTMIMYGQPETTTGGMALRFYCSMRIKLQRTGSVENKEGSKLAGKYKITIVKNKLATPYREAEYYMNETGIYTKQKKQ